MAKPALRIDRMVLDLPGGSAADGRRVGELVAAGLAAAGALPEAGDLPRVRVVLREPADRDPEALARRIVDATLRALARTV
jgi:hypothetical protein